MTAFTLFGLTVQALLLVFFVGVLRRSSWESTVGAIVYGMGIGAAFLAVGLLGLGAEPYLVLAPVLYAAWAALGAWVDIVRPTAWRTPPRWEVIGPYVGLLVASSLAFWIPLWWVDLRLWVAFGLLYAAHTTINITTHRSRQRPRAGADRR